MAGRADAPTIKRTKVLASAKVNGPAVNTATENNDHMVQAVTTAIKNFTSRLYQDEKFHHTDGRILYVGPYDKIRNTATHNRNICDAARKTYKGRHKVALENARNIMEDIRFCGRISTTILTNLENWVETIRPEVEEDKLKAANDRARDYRNFIKETVNEKGSQILHRLAREPKPQAPVEITTNRNIKTTADQAHADNQRGIWKEVWKGKDTQTTRTLISLPHKPIELPNKMDLERFRNTIRSFKHTTATTYDNLRPHILDELTDDAINEIILLFRHIENEGRWPKQWKHPIMVMIPKPKHGEWRLIAMLPALYRIWAKQAGKDVSAWMHSLTGSGLPLDLGRLPKPQHMTSH